MIWHLTQELQATSLYENLTTYRELDASFATRFHDITEVDDPGLKDPNSAIGHRAGQALAAAHLAQESNGLIYSSVRNQGGQYLAAFRLNLVQNIRLGITWSFEWAGSEEPEIYVMN